MSGDNTPTSRRGFAGGAPLAGVAAAFAAFIAFHRFEFCGIGVRAAVGYALAAGLAGGGLGIFLARGLPRLPALVPGALAAGIWAGWAAGPALPFAFTAAVAVMGFAALAWLLSVGCSTRGQAVRAALGGLLGFVACAAGLMVLVPPAACVGAAAAAAAALWMGRRTEPEGVAPAGAAAGLLLAVAWGAVAVGTLRAYLPLARAAAYVASDQGMALMAGVALGALALRRDVRRPTALAMGGAGLLVIALLNGYSFFAYPDVVLGESAALQTPAAMLRPETCFPLWLAAFAVGAIAGALWPGRGAARQGGALFAAALGAAVAGMSAGYLRTGYVIPVGLAAAAVVASCAVSLRRGARAGLPALASAAALGGVAWAAVAAPLCGVPGLRQSLRGYLAGIGLAGKATVLREALTPAGLSVELRAGGRDAEFAGGQLVRAGRPGAIPAPIALAVALPLCMGEPAGSVGVVAPHLGVTFECARLLAGDAQVRSVNLWEAGPGERLDVIICGPGPLSTVGSPLAVVSREGLARVKERLAPGGVFALWLPAGALEPADLRRALATVAGEFPGFYVFLRDGDAVLVTGSGLDSGRLRSAQTRLESQGFWEPLDLVDGFTAVSEELGRLVEGVRPFVLSRPERPPLMARDLTRPVQVASLAALAQHRLRGPVRLAERIEFGGALRRSLALRGFEARYAEQTRELLHSLGTRARAGQARELAAFVRGPVVELDLFADARGGTKAQAAGVFLALGLPEAAAATLQQALAAGDDSAQLRVRLAGVLEELSRSDEAIGQYREALRLDPGEPRAERRLTMLLIGRGRYTEAARELSAIVERQPDSVNAMLLLGQLYGGPLKRPEEGARLARRVMEIDPDNAIARELLALCASASPAAKPPPGTAQQP